ncbi:YdeI family protein [Yoonia maritima]|uniref:YdeI/OmpD-associated family protein n=1 Tax=Yoonia maritima TaxID=1435347 RepID=UPI003736520A
MTMITEIEDYFTKGCGRCSRFDTPACSTTTWADGLAVLRDICRDAGLEETVKWGHPCYMHAGRNIALIGAFKGDFRLTFMNASLLKDPEGVLKPSGPNSATPSVMYLTSADDVERLRPVMQSYLAELKGFAEAGIKPPKVERELELPEELIAALDDDPELAEAFHSLTPGRQKSYVINLNGAKQSATRVNRIAKFRDKIIAGKGALER